MGLAAMNVPLNLLRAGAVCLLLAGCAGKPPLKPAAVPPPVIGNAEVEKFFAALPQGRLELSLETPGRSYAKDPAEKDVVGNLDTSGLSPVPQKGKALVEMAYQDPDGNQLIVHGVDLLDLVPVVGQRGGLQNVEYLLKEFERFGILFYRKERAVSWNAV